MFRLTPDENFKKTVTVKVIQANGSSKEESFTGIFKRATEAEREALLELKHRDLVRDRMVGWQMKDETGADVPFNDENFEALLQLSGAVREATIAFWEANVGAREKNSSR